MVGMALDESLNGRIRISVVATGIDSSAPSMSHMPKFQVVGGGVAESVSFPGHVQAQPAPAPVGVHREPVMQAASAQGAGYIPQPPAKPLLSAAFQGAAEHAELEMEEPARPGRAAAPTPAPPRPVMPEAVRTPEAPKRTSLFSRVFGGAASPNAAPAARAAHQEPVINTANYRQEPTVADLHAQHEQQREPARAAVRPAQVDEIGLEIPAFLRRSSN